VSARNVLGESGDSNEASATPQAPPDVVVSSFTVPTYVGAGTTILVSITTKNQGAGAANASTTRFYLSANGLLDAADTLLGGAQIVPALGPGAVSSASVSIDIPGGLPAGSHYLIANADADNVLTENQEGNNTSLRLLLIGPDLIVSALTVPATGAAGATISVTDTVKNQGGGGAAASTTRFYLSTNAVFDAADILLNGTRSVPDLAAGASSQGSATVLIPSSTGTGTYYVIAQADGSAAVAESSESNNTTARAIQIGGDLIVSALTVPAKGGAGSVIAVGDTTTNRGAATIGASVTRFYLSGNTVLDTADVLLDGSRAVPQLAAGTSSSGQTLLTIPAGTPVGTYYVVAKCDADEAVSETLETNNTAIRAIQIGGDLVVSALSVPTTGGAGMSIVVTDTTANQGGDAVTSPSTTAFYLSLNAVLDAADVPLNGSRAIGALAAGAGSSGSTTVTIAAGTTAGTYYLIAKADAGSTVVETQETNNTAVRVIYVGPDLRISSLSAASSVVAGSIVSVSSTILNAGGEMAGPSTARFYLSSNVLLDASDIPLVETWAVASLAAGTSSTGSTPVTIPGSVVPGSYYLLGKADADAAVMESQEANNVAARAVQVTAGP
jgi:subtilase family serine protease